MLTNNEEYSLRVELEDFDGNKRYIDNESGYEIFSNIFLNIDSIFFHIKYRYAQYSHFKIYSEAEYYKLEIDGYEGNAGDSLNDPWYGSNSSPFSTFNR